MKANVMIRKVNTFENCSNKKILIRYKISKLYYAMNGIDFYGTEHIETLHLDPLRSNFYQPSDREILFNVLKKLDIKHDSIVDFGCGKG